MITITHPVPNEVVQRANNNVGYVLLEGECDTLVSRIVAEFTPVEDVNLPKQGTASGRMVIIPTAGRFSARVPVAGGWYKLKATPYTANGTDGPPAYVDKVGVGEVFLIFGHSVAQADETAYVGAKDQRVVAPNQFNVETASVPFEFGPLIDNASRGPFNAMPGPHGLFGDMLVQRLNVPVAFFGAAFGGSNLDQNRKVIDGVFFTHGFINFSKGMPFEPVKRSLVDFASKTGLRAIISQHGINDAGRPEEEFYQDYKKVIETTRGIYDAELPWVVILDGKQTDDIEPERAAIRRIWNMPNVYPGFDFREITSILADPVDKVHPKLESEWKKYATLLSASVSDDFLKKSKPILTKSNSKIADPESTEIAVLQPRTRTALLKLPNVAELLPDEVRQDWTEISTPTKVIVGVMFAVLIIALIIASND